MSENPNLLISGASRGLGAETAAAAARLGANLILTARSEAGLKETARRISEVSPGSSVTLFPGDLGDPDHCRRLAERVRELGPLNGVILNAARVEPIGSIEDLDEAQWMRSVDLNLGSPFRLAKHLIPMLSKTSGRLITIGTGAATQPIPSWSAYCASKAALLMLTRVIAAEKPEITSFSFTPGVVNTTMQQTIRERRESMPAQIADYFSTLHESGQLEPPEVPGRALAWCALYAPKEWSGQEINYTDPELVSKVREAFD